MINLDSSPQYELTIGAGGFYPVQLPAISFTEKDKLDIVRISFQERIGYTSKVEVKFRDSHDFNPELSDILLKTSLRFLLGWAGNKEPLFLGNIIQVGPRFAKDASSELLICAHDQGFLLKYPSGPRFNYGNTVDKVVRTFLDKYREKWGIEYTIDPVEKLRKWKLSEEEEGYVQVDETDFEILSWLAKHAGYEISIRLDEDGQNHIYFVDRKFFSRPEQQKKKFTFYHTPRESDFDDDSGLVLYSFEPEMKLAGQRTKVNVISWSSIDQNGVKRGTKSLDPAGKGERNFTEVKVEANEIVTLRIHGRTAQDAAAAKVLAEAELEKRSENLVRGEALIKGWPAIRAGQEHKLVLRALGDIGEKYSGDYRIEAVEHRKDQSGFYTRFDVSTDSIRADDGN